MSDWNIEPLLPVSLEGNSYSLEFDVSRSGGMQKRVKVRFTRPAMQVFAEEMRNAGKQLDSQVREEIMTKWGEQKIGEYLERGYELPPCVTLGTTRAHGPHTWHTAPLNAQLMLREWELI